MDGAGANLTLGGDLSELERCGRWVADTGERLKLPNKLIFSLDLCFEEAVSNIILYGLKDARPEDQEVRIVMAIEGDALRVVIEDRGVAFDPTTAPDHEQPSDIDHAKIGGLGILLLKKFTTAMTYSRAGDTNRLILEFSLIEN